jgi:hypothetical protein
MEQPKKTIAGVTATTCRGTTLAGNTCTRTANLDANGYCHQHAQSKPNDNNNIDIAAAPQQQQQQQEAVAPLPKSNAGESESVGSSEEHKSATRASGSEESSSSVHLVRCVGISRSTNVQCKNHVSFEGETHCSIHGGSKKGPVLPLLSQCNAIAKLTRVQCTKRVSVPGEQFCPAHHGKIKASVRLVAVMSPSVHQDSPVHLAETRASSSASVEMMRDGSSSAAAAAAAAITGLNTIPWAAIQAQTIAYLVDVHPSTCICTPNNRCQTMQSIKLMLSLAGNTASLNANPETISQWFRLLGAASDPTKFWQLSIYQLIVNASASSVGPAAAATRPAAPSGFAFRMPSDGLDSFLNEDPTSANNSNNNNVSSTPF